MNIRNLILFGAAIFMAACSDEEGIDRHNGGNGNDSPVLVGLNIKDAKYIYGSESNTRSSSVQYRQIKKDGTDMILGWITEKGDTVEVKNITNIWDINEKYLLVNTNSPIKLEEKEDKPKYDGNGYPLLDESVEVFFGVSYLIDKQTESVFEIKGHVKIGEHFYDGYFALDGSKAITDKNGNIYMSIDKSLWGENIKPILFKIHTQDQSDLKIESYAEINSEDYFYNEDMKYDWFVVNSQGTCFYDKRYIRPSSGTRQYTIGQFIKGSTYGAGFVSSDKNDLYLTAIGGQENDSYLTVAKLSDNGNGLQGEEVAEIATYFYEPNYKICTLWNQFKNSTIIWAGDFYEFNMDDYSLTKIDADLWGFFQKNSYTTTTASFIQNSVDKLNIVSLRDYSTKTIDLANEGIDLRNIYTMEGSEFLHFSGFRYTDSQSVIGTIDENGNVAISETLPVNTITTIIQIK
ncbi:hypothetical protein [Bacteroides gallinaceum]|uniref:DUF4374 domain-containing protein n=1 Tax=Bacteroides gallinaceum TaxID=1462571 RepID=A0ABT7VES5_9BACE|nr:hypothetical protein [Bacteroides gallinaceum]MDM8324788.1 hypothetical protein [Bacteroides gallinaceum]